MGKPKFHEKKSTKKITGYVLVSIFNNFINCQFSYVKYGYNKGRVRQNKQAKLNPLPVCLECDWPKSSLVTMILLLAPVPDHLFEDTFYWNFNKITYT